MTTATLLWVMIGVLIALGFDSRQMKKSVPFASVPLGLASVCTLRVVSAVIVVLFWPFILIQCFFEHSGQNNGTSNH